MSRPLERATQCEAEKRAPGGAASTTGHVGVGRRETPLLVCGTIAYVVSVAYPKVTYEVLPYR